LALAATTACAREMPPPGHGRSPTLPAAEKTLSLIATTDLHGHVEALPLLAGYVSRVRRIRQADGGTLLLDAGDYLQGTLESNQEEGRVVVSAYRQMGYDAVALGNHEFDFGPDGETVPGPGVDLFGALRARIREADHPVLSINLIDAQTKRRPTWQGLGDSVLVDVAGVRVGLVGALTEETPRIVMPAYFQGLDVVPLAPLLAAKAAALRGAGARVVVAMTHLGAACARFDDPNDASSCKPGSELERLVRALPAGSVDVVFGGHTHQAVAHRINGVAVAQAYAYGRAFSRVDVRVPTHGMVRTTLHAPRDLCTAEPGCTSADYEGARVTADPSIARLIAPAEQRAAARRDATVGVEIEGTVRRAFDKPSDLGNLFADLLLEHAPDAQVAVMNGGGLRADLPPGPLRYGALFEAMPFDNRVARVTLSVGELSQLLARHLTSSAHGILSVGGVRVTATCRGATLDVALTDQQGRRLSEQTQIVVVTSDYLATGGDELFAGLDLTGRSKVDTATLLRDAFAAALKRRGKLRAEDPARWSKDSPRLALPTPRPVTCP
jgi:5'-nucleotidase